MAEPKKFTKKLASGPKTRARVLSIAHPGYMESRRAVNERKWAESQRKRDEMPPPQFEGANSPLAMYESTDSDAVKRERQLREGYRSPPGVSRPIVRPSPRPADLKTFKRETVVYKTPRGGGETVIRKNPDVAAPKPAEKMVPKPKLRPSAPKPAAKKQVKPPVKKQTFDSAFAAARKKGLKEFVHNGKRYTTKVKR